jgi:phospholipid N-methyltransferase
VTEEILRYSENISSLILLESDPARVVSLERFHRSNVKVILGDAREIGTFLTRESIDTVISTLPLGSMESDAVDTILSEIHSVLKK